MITSCEFDHADIYESLETIELQFKEFAQLIPNNRLAWFARTPRRPPVLEGVSAPTVTYGFNGVPDWTAKYSLNGSNRPQTLAFHKGINVADQDLPIVGKHNVLNALAATGCGPRFWELIRPSFRSLVPFQGGKKASRDPRGAARNPAHRRFRSSPHCGQGNLRSRQNAVSAKTPASGVQTETNTNRTATFQKDYINAFSSADLIVLREPRDANKVDSENRFSSPDIGKGPQNLR